MRWRKPKNGDRRVITKFLFFPRNIWGDVRWLERVKIEQRFVDFAGYRWWKDIIFMEN